MKSNTAMNQIKLLPLATIVGFAFAFTAIQSYSWSVKENYSIKCSVGKNGSLFKGLKATITFDELHPEKSKISASIDARSIDTGNSLMNSHALDEEGLYAAVYPQITFVSTAVKSIGASRYEATGNLTLKGITKEMKLPFTFNSKENVINRFPMVTMQTFSGYMTLVPKDFNITRMGTPDQVTIALEVPVTK